MIFRAYRRTEPLNPFETDESWSSSKRYMVTVGFGSRFSEAAARLCRQAETTGWFDGVFRLTEESNESWVQQYLSSTREFRQRNPKGFGLWSWKPFFVLNSLTAIEEGAHLYYFDAGCELSQLGERRMMTMDRHVRDNGCLFFTLPFAEKDWTKPDLLAHYNGRALGATPQVQATWFGLANIESIRDLMKRWWYDCSRDDYDALRDPPAGAGGSRHSFQHRHDQSVLSCTIKSQRPTIPTKPWEDVYAPWLYVPNSWVLLEPVHALRLTRKDSLIDPLVRQSSVNECRASLLGANRAFRRRAFLCQIYHRVRDEAVLAKLALQRSMR